MEEYLLFCEYVYILTIVQGFINPRQAFVDWITDEALSRAFRSSNNYDNKSEGPVNTELLEYMPEIIVQEDNKIPTEKKDCVICLETFANGDKVTILACAHLFHKDCIVDWLKVNDLCPICKYRVNKDDFNIK